MTSNNSVRFANILAAFALAVAIMLCSASTGHAQTIFDGEKGRLENCVGCGQPTINTSENGEVLMTVTGNRARAGAILKPANSAGKEQIFATNFVPAGKNTILEFTAGKNGDTSAVEIETGFFLGFYYNKVVSKHPATTVIYAGRILDQGSVVIPQGNFGWTVIVNQYVFGGGIHGVRVRNGTYVADTAEGGVKIHDVVVAQ